MHKSKFSGDYQGLTCWGDLNPGVGNGWWWLFGCFSVLERSWVCFRLAIPTIPGSRLLLNLYKLFGIICERACRAQSAGSFRVPTHTGLVTHAVSEWMPHHVPCCWRPCGAPENEPHLFKLRASDMGIGVPPDAVRWHWWVVQKCPGVAQSLLVERPGRRAWARRRA